MTIIKMLCGLLRPTSGQILVGGFDLSNPGPICFCWRYRRSTWIRSAAW